MIRNVIIRNMDTGEELTMPVAPESYVTETGRRVETVDMAAAGQVNLPGLETLFNENQEFLLPASNASYVTGGWRDPWEIVAKLEKWSLDANVARYIITGTSVNAPVLIENVRYREQDGTNDVYLTLTLKKYRYLTAARVEAQILPTDNDARPDEGEAVDSGTTYTVAAGDCLWTICQKYYGDGSLCYKLATYNGIPNSYLIHPGDVLQIPDRAVLDGTAPTLPPASSGSTGTTASPAPYVTPYTATSVATENAFQQKLMDQVLDWNRENDVIVPVRVPGFTHGYH